jgi:hypothetical protein
MQCALVSMNAMCPAQTILLVKINSWILHVHGRNSRVTTFSPYRMDSIIETTVILLLRVIQILMVILTI